MGHGSGRGSHRTPFSHQNTCRHVNPPSMWIQIRVDFRSVQSHQGCAAGSVPNTSVPGCHSPLGSGGGIRPSLTFSCSSFWASRRVWRRNFFCSFFVKYTPRVTGVSLSTGREMRPSGRCPGGYGGTRGPTGTRRTQPNPPSQGHTRGVELGRVLHQVCDPEVLVFL